MSKTKVYSGTKSRIGAFFLALTIPFGVAATAHADIDNAASELDALGISYNQEDVVAADLVTNVDAAVQTQLTTGQIPEKYSEITISPVITIDAANHVMGAVTTKNLQNWINYVNSRLDPNEPDIDFNYSSFATMFADNERDNEVGVSVENAVQAIALAPKKEDINAVINYVINNRTVMTPGAARALLADIGFLQALVTISTDPETIPMFAQALGVSPEQLADAADTLEGVTNLSVAQGDNANVVTFIKTLNNQGC